MHYSALLSPFHENLNFLCSYQQTRKLLKNDDDYKANCMKKNQDTQSKCSDS